STAKEIRVFSGAGKEDTSGVGWLKKAIGGLLGMPTYEEGCNSVMFSPDRKTLITVGTQGTVRLWDAGSGKELKRYAGDGNWTQSASLSPDGKILASAHQDQMVRLRDLATGKTLQQFRGQQGGWISCVAFSPDGCIVASGDQMGMIRFW